METHYETTRPGAAENNVRPGNKHTGTPNNGRGTQQGQGNRQQERLDKWLLASPTPNIEAVGDPLRLRPDGEVTDGILRVGFQNIRGADFNRGFGLAPELDAMNEIGTDIQGMTEANKPWNSRIKQSIKSNSTLCITVQQQYTHQLRQIMTALTNQGGRCASCLATQQAYSSRAAEIEWAGSAGTRCKGNKTRASYSLQHIEYAMIPIRDHSRRIESNT